MPDWLNQAFSDGGDASLGALWMRLIVAFGLGLAVAGIYARTHRRDATFQPGFITTLVLLAILIAVVTQVIGGNVARAFSLVGALAIVRFRTVVADTRDTAFVIFAVVEGMAAGAGHYQVAIAGLLVGGAASFLVRPRGGSSASWRLTVRLGIGVDQALIEPTLTRHFAIRELVASSTTRQGAAIEVVYRAQLAPASSPAAVVAELNGIAGVQQADLVREALA
jgi:hypothetical protein